MEEIIYWLIGAIILVLLLIRYFWKHAFPETCEHVKYCPLYQKDSEVCNKMNGVYGYDRYASCVLRLRKAKKDRTVHLIKRGDGKPREHFEG